ncbi:MAG TPA: LytR C-terminal domain-containing protein [Xanthomonadales bacterium]|nr:LytR C-terminal domain-containing protein [Xanthomonadales bacterium]
MQGSRYYMKDEIPFQDFPAYSEKSTNKKPLVIFLVVLLIIAAGVGGLYFLGRSRGAESNIVIPTEAPLPTEEPTSTPSASVSGTLTPAPSGTSSKLDRASLNVVVLNGSGVVGAGRRYATYLTGLGYTVSSTGNADTFDYTGITVKVKKAKSDYGALLKKDLASFASGSVITTSIDDTITTDAAVIIGK